MGRRRRRRSRVAGGPLVYFGLTDLGAPSCVAILLASQPARLILAVTAAWMRIAAWLVA